MADICLIHPPGASVEFPPLGIACLAAFLKQDGRYSHDIKELNLPYLAHLLDPDLLRQQREALVQQLRENADDRLDATLKAYDAVALDVSASMELFKNAAQYFRRSDFDRAVHVVKHALNLYADDEALLSYRFEGDSYYIDWKGAAAGKKRLISLLRDIQEKPSTRLEAFFGRYFSHDNHKVFGFSIGNAGQLVSALIASKVIKAEQPDAKVVLGGSWITTRKDSLTSHGALFDLVDALSIYEGEASLLELLGAYTEERPIENVPNLYHVEHDAVAFTQTEKVDDLNTLPLPCFEGLNVENHWTPYVILPFYHSRGCSYDVCEFCNHHDNYFGKARRRRVQSTHEGLAHLQETYHARHFFMVDELLDWPDLKALCQLNVDSEKEFSFYVHSRVRPNVTSQEADLLAKGGVTYLHVGMESADTETLKAMKKGYRREDVERFLQAFSNVSLSLHLNLIEGYPGETPKQYEETCKLVLEHLRVIDQTHLYKFELVKGAPIEKKGSPHITIGKAEHPDDLSWNMPFERNSSEIMPLDHQPLRELLAQKASISGPFPQQAKWAGNLLYVDHFKRFPDHKDGLMARYIDALAKHFQDLNVLGKIVEQQKTLRIRIQTDRMVRVGSKGVAKNEAQVFLQCQTGEMLRIPGFLCDDKGIGPEISLTPEVVSENPEILPLTLKMIGEGVWERLS